MGTPITASYLEYIGISTLCVQAAQGSSLLDRVRFIPPLCTGCGLHLERLAAPVVPKQLPWLAAEDERAASGIAVSGKAGGERYQVAYDRSDGTGVGTPRGGRAARGRWRRRPTGACDLHLADLAAPP